MKRLKTEKALQLNIESSDAATKSASALCKEVKEWKDAPAEARSQGVFKQVSIELV